MAKGDLVGRFTADDWRELTPAESAHHCRLMAKEAIARAQLRPQFAKLYLDLADDWLKLAVELEQSSELLN